LRSGATASNSGHIFGGQAGTSEYDYSINGASGATIGSGATLSNDGVITGGQGGTNNVDLGLHDVTKGGAGVVINGGVLIDGGTISGGAGGLLPGRVGAAGDAVDFTGSAGTLVVEQGAVFNGNVVADSGVAVLLEVTGNVDLAGVGSQFLNFSGISFASGAAATVEGNGTGLGASVTIDGFTEGDTLILDGFVVNPAATTYAANTGLELTDTLGNHITLDIVEPANAATGNFRAAATPGGTSITYIACFAAGTRILRADGRQVAVEALAVGDALETQDGSAAEIIWLGRRGIDLARHARPAAARPVLIAAGALGGGLPLRDLLVSPDHGMCLGDHLIPAKVLTNGASIRQIDCDTVTYYHIELASHAVIFAEGAAAESYLDTGNRGAFENAAGAIIAHPDFAQTRRVAMGCLPFAESGPAVEAARRRLLKLANIETTKEPAKVIRYEGGGAMIASRHAIPGEINADPRDRRM